MGQNSVEKYIGKILTDDMFRHEANRSFDKACAAEGFVFTDEERLALMGIDRDLIERLSMRIDMGIKRSGAFIGFDGGLSPSGTSGDK